MKKTSSPRHLVSFWNTRQVSLSPKNHQCGLSTLYFFDPKGFPTCARRRRRRDGVAVPLPAPFGETDPSFHTTLSRRDGLGDFSKRLGPCSATAWFYVWKALYVRLLFPTGFIQFFSFPRGVHIYVFLYFGFYLSLWSRHPVSNRPLSH